VSASTRVTPVPVAPQLDSLRPRWRGLLAWLVGLPATEAELHRNSFDLLRLALALLVIVSHAYPLSGQNASESLAIWSRSQFTWGEVGLAGFFVVSGYFITRSYAQVDSLPRFLWHRALRILPGYWMCLLVTVFVAGPLLAVLAGLPLERYWFASTDGPLAYLWANWHIEIVQWNVSGLPNARVPYPLTVDGSLWSLWVEVRCYLAVGLLCVLGVLRIGIARLLVPLAAGLCVVGLIVWFRAPTLLAGEPAHTVWTIGMDGSLLNTLLWACFFVGASAYVYRRFLLLSPLLALVALVGYMLLLRTNAFIIGVVLLQSYVLLTIGFRVGVRLAYWLRSHIGDLSYGTYIYAFVIAQVLAQAGLARRYPFRSTCCSPPRSRCHWRMEAGD
jgi:peptidoglycan/LPS O-acetylase OafA/YrhL